MTTDENYPDEHITYVDVSNRDMNVVGIYAWFADGERGQRVWVRDLSYTEHAATRADEHLLRWLTAEDPREVARRQQAEYVALTIIVRSKHVSDGRADTAKNRSHMPRTSKGCASTRLRDAAIS